MMAGSYLCSGWALRRTPGLTPVGMLCNATQGMIAIFLLGIGFVWRNTLVTEAGSYILPMLGIVLFYSLGQGLVFLAQRNIDASRIVPLLGLKLPILALFNLLVLHHGFTWRQLAAIALTVLAAFVLNNAGRRIGWLNLALVLCGCVSYCLSDTFIAISVKRMTASIYQDDLLRASAANTLIAFCLCGIAGAAAVRLGPRSFRVRHAALNSMPYALFWVPSVILFSVCIGHLGTVGGNIIQSSRGLLAILFVQLLGMFGLYQVDGKATPEIVFRRILAAMMIIAATTLYNM